MKEVVVEKSTPKILFLACGSLLFIFWGFSKLSRGDIGDKVFGILAILFFGMSFFAPLRALLRHEGALVINKEGFADNVSLPGIGVGFISWEQVEEVRLSTFLWVMKFISVKIKDAKHFETRAPWYAKMWIKSNKIFGYPSINMSLGAAKERYRYEDIVDTMQGFLDAWREKHSHEDLLNSERV